MLKSLTLDYTLALTNKLINIYTIGRGARNISIKKWKFYYFKIKIIPFIIKFRRNYAIFMDKFKS